MGEQMSSLPPSLAMPLCMPSVIKQTLYTSSYTANAMRSHRNVHAVINMANDHLKQNGMNKLETQLETISHLYKPWVILVGACIKYFVGTSLSGLLIVATVSTVSDYYYFELLTKCISSYRFISNRFKLSLSIHLWFSVLCCMRGFPGPSFMM